MSRWLHRWVVATAFATLILLGAGGLVTSHGVGMAVPDWPNTYGYNMFFFPVSQWIGGIFYEHTHRLIGSAVGLMTAIMAVWLFGRPAKPFLRWSGAGLLGLAMLAWAVAPARWADAVVLAATGATAAAASFFWPRSNPAPRWLRWLGVIAFFAVVIQGLLGGLRVILFQDHIGIFHGTLAQLFFAFICVLALFTSRWSVRKFSHGDTEAGNRTWQIRTCWIFLGTTLLILLQLVLGATMRHQHAGLAIPDFPLAYGKIWPATDEASVVGYNQRRIEVVSAKPITSAQIVLQMTHRLLAIAILAAVGVCAWRTRQASRAGKEVKRLAFVWLGLILVQVLLGAATIWSNKAADIATAHVLVGALSLALGSILCIVSFRVFALAGQPVARKDRANGGVTMPLSPRPAPAEI